MIELRFGLKDVSELPSLEEFEKLAESQGDLFPAPAVSQSAASQITVAHSGSSSRARGRVLLGGGAVMNGAPTCLVLEADSSSALRASSE